MSWGKTHVKIINPEAYRYVLEQTNLLVVIGYRKEAPNK
jgi:K+/H+ antiporter YhaU regulatory subunit KhtT